MPKSKRSPQPSRLRGNRWVTLPLIVLAGALFLSGSIGVRAGIVILPFDQHHVIGQFGGAAILIVGSCCSRPVDTHTPYRYIHRGSR